MTKKTKFSYSLAILSAFLDWKQTPGVTSWAVDEVAYDRFTFSETPLTVFSLKSIHKLADSLLILKSLGV